MSVYNGARFLGEAIDSVLAQTLDNFEFVIVDDGSTDRTPAILEGYADSRILLLRNTHNVGLTRSLNRGLAAARGTYVARQDADDRSLPERFARQVSYLDAYPELAVVGTAHIALTESGQTIRTAMHPLEHTEIRERLLYDGSQFCHGSVMARKSCLDAVGGYDERFAVSQDLDLFLRLSERFRLANLPEPLYQLRVWKGSVTEQRRTQKHALLATILEEAVQRQSSCRVRPETLGRLYWRLALVELSGENRARASHYLDMARAENPHLDKDGAFLLQKALHVAFDSGPTGRLRYKTAGDVAQGFAFLNAVFDALPTEMARTRALRRWAQAELHAAYAFSAYKARDGKDVRRHCWQAWRTHATHIANLGLLSIFVRSTLSYRQKGRPA
jgi:glycosyltransferase involved in cell wall biosynthesis